MEVPLHLEISDVRKAENMQLLRCLQVKGVIKEHNKKFTWSAVKDLPCESFWRVESEKLRKNISHVRDKLEDH